MPNSKIITLYNWALLCSLATFVACANVVIPSGGEKDSQAPFVVASKPANKKTNHISKEIIIEFNEYFKLINPSENENHSRYSMPFFLHPRDEVVLSDRYTAKSYLEERLKQLGLK